MLRDADVLQLAVQEKFDLLRGIVIGWMKERSLIVDFTAQTLFRECGAVVRRVGLASDHNEAAVVPARTQRIRGGRCGNAGAGDHERRLGHRLRIPAASAFKQR